MSRDSAICPITPLSHILARVVQCYKDRDMDRRIIVKKLEIIRQRCAVERRRLDRYSVRIAEYTEPGKYIYQSG